ncbi:MAG: Cna B-type domain-containing protein, partial [Dysosmobacter sp.]|nr:Cna B-type domain-containing protein [Dysosmobacter sp.]
MKKRARWLLAVVLTVAMTMSCMPAASAAGSSKKAKAVMPNLSTWGLNVDLSGVPAQVQAAVANMIAQGEEPMEKETDAFLAEVVEEASGISFEAVKGSLGLELLSGAEGTVDTSRFNLGEEEFNRVMKEVLTDYFLTNLAYSCDVEDGIVTGIRFMSASQASSYRRMYTASDLWSMFRTPLTASTLSATRVANDPAALSEDDGETGGEGEGETETANERTVTLQVKWKDNNKKANRPESVTVYLDDGKDSKNYYYYSFETVKDGEASIVVPDKDSEGNVIEYEIAEEGVKNGRLEGRNDASYKVTTSQDGNTYTVINTADGKNGEEYDVAFNWAQDDQFVRATQDEIDKGHSIDIGIGYPVALTLVYDAEKKAVGYGPKTTIDFKLESVTLTPKDGDGSEKIVLEPTEENGVDYETMYAFGEHESLNRADFGKNADYASTIKYATYDCKYGTFEDRKDVTASAEQIHWNQMLTFTRDYAKHFGVAGDFWTSKNTEKTPYGAFKTQLDSYPEDYMPDAVMDQYMELMTLAYMSYEQSYGSLLDQKIADCLAQLDDSMTPVQKYLVIHDWIANNAEFDMGVLVKTAAGTGNPDPAQMTAFGTLLS